MKLEPRQEIRILTLGVLVVASMMVAVILLGVTRQAAITQELNLVAHEHHAHSQLANEMYRLARERTLLLQKITVEEDLFAQDELVQSYDDLGHRFMEARRRLLSQQQVAPREQALLSGLLQTTGRTAAVQQNVIDLALKGRRSQAQRLLLEQAVPLQDKVVDQLMALVEYSNAQTKKTVAQAQEIERSGELLLMGTGGTVVALTLLIGFYVRHRVRNLTVNMESLVAARTQEIEEGAEMMERITAAALDAIVMVDDNDKVIFWNPAAESVFGYRREEALGRKLHHLVMPSRFQEQMSAGFARFIRTGQGDFIGQAREVMALHREGHEFPLELSLSAVRVKDRWVGIGLCRDITERRRTQQILEQMALTDTLTGLSNRRSFDATMHAEIKRAERYQTSLSLALFDIDHFKAVNDTHGHLAGDQILQTFARQLSGNIRGSDSLVRWGGEEFAVLSANTSLESMRVLAEKLRRAIDGHVFPVVGHITCSVGLTMYQPGEQVEAFLHRADLALFAAKSGGRNRVEAS
jgi:diguanylate cyclase (GGDEF)-like protein/PAS domain S-box-containing protein